MTTTVRAEGIGAGTAAAYMALLDDPSVELQEIAADKLLEVVDVCWPPISEQILEIEALFEDQGEETALRRKLALLISKVHFHLGACLDSLSIGLSAADDFARTVFELEPESVYSRTLLTLAFDTYAEAQRAARAEGPHGMDWRCGSKAVSAEHEAVVLRLFDKYIAEREYKQVLGLAIEACRGDIVERVFAIEPDLELMRWLVGVVCVTGDVVRTSLEYRNCLVELCVAIMKTKFETPDYYLLIQCLVVLRDAQVIAGFLVDLATQGRDESLLVALQLAFDLVDMVSQELLLEIRSGVTKAEGAHASQPESGHAAALARVASILSGEETIKWNLEFMHRNNKTDILALKTIRDALDVRSSLSHSAVSFANAFANAGTMSDLFLRQNLDWLARARNWSKFTATAALGVIHRGNIMHGRAILDAYLPKLDALQSSSERFRSSDLSGNSVAQLDGGGGASAGGGGGGGSSASSPPGGHYSEGGALFALGLIHANHANDETLTFLRQVLAQSGHSDVIQHGATLGLGVAAMGYQSDSIVDEIVENALWTDSAINGEAAGLAMGLVKVGSADMDLMRRMLQFADESSHEKAIRGLAVGIALVSYGRGASVHAFIVENLLAAKDPLIRYGAMYAIGLAHVGSADTDAIQLLLKTAVSDVSDDVRRAAVTSLGFVSCTQPHQVPKLVQLLSESYNPHVRYGAALALGIACAGTGLQDALVVLDPLLRDASDFVRQGAAIAMAMILSQQSDAVNEYVPKARTYFEQTVTDKHEYPMPKFGAALGQGILDCGGRNAVVSLVNKNGSPHLPAVVGTALFTQFWYWFPLAHTLSLAFAPTAIIALDVKMHVPDIAFTSNALSVLFAYPPPKSSNPAKEKKSKLPSVQLSTSQKERIRQKEKNEEKDKSMALDDNDKDDEDTEPKPLDSADVLNAVKLARTKQAPFSLKNNEIQPSTSVSNLARVTPAQLPFISVPPESRYTPVLALPPLPLVKLAALHAAAHPNTTAAISTTTVAGVTTQTTRLSSTDPVVPGLKSFYAAPSILYSASRAASFIASALPLPDASAIPPPAGYALAGGIVLMKDSRPDLPPSNLNLTVDDNSAPPAPQPSADTADTAADDEDLSDEEFDHLLSQPVADPPPPFIFEDWGDDDDGKPQQRNDDDNPDEPSTN